jgi:hypothetical protein
MAIVDGHGEITRRRGAGAWGYDVSPDVALALRVALAALAALLRLCVLLAEPGSPAVRRVGRPLLELLLSPLALAGVTLGAAATEAVALVLKLLVGGWVLGRLLAPVVAPVVVPARMPRDVWLRRRYVAGDLTYPQFQREMIAHLRARYARGELGLHDYEAQIERLVAPTRRVDVERDPTVSHDRRAW